MFLQKRKTLHNKNSMASSIESSGIWAEGVVGSIHWRRMPTCAVRNVRECFGKQGHCFPRKLGHCTTRAHASRNMPGLQHVEFPICLCSLCIQEAFTVAQFFTTPSFGYPMPHGMWPNVRSCALFYFIVFFPAGKDLFAASWPVL